MDTMNTSIKAVLKNLIINFNTLLDCPVRFSGEYSEQKVHWFIEYIEYYKRIKCIADKQALEELQYLLLDKAYDWWVRRKARINTWSEALTILENQFSKKRPSNVVYTQILKDHYEDYESKDDFIDDKIELFNELTDPELKEKTKLEILYALLPIDLQNNIKLVNITDIKDLKDQLKLAKQSSVEMLSNKTGTEPSKSGDPSEANVILTEQTNIEQSINKLPEAHIDSVKEHFIKVRRTEDLMLDVKEEEESPLPTEEFLDNSTECSVTNNIFCSSNENFQIDTDIMNQINNIINESEMNIDVMNKSHIATTILPQHSDCVISMELLGFSMEQSKLPVRAQKHQSKPTEKSTKKLKKRCTYCRHFNHTAQICFKKSKHMKLFPERFMREKSKDNFNTLQNTINESNEISATESSCNLSTKSNQAIESLVTKPALNRNPTSLTHLVEIAPVVTNSNVVLNLTEKINPVLTTKLIAPITGKTPNKTLAAKLRNVDTPSPKCHQCGTLGFYKSICPNCSPIYNNNSNNHYSK